MIPKKWLIRLSIAVLALGLVVIIIILSRPAPVVEVTYTRNREVVELVIASGSIRANRRSNVGSEVTGVVRNVLADEGDFVTAAQPLVQLDQADVLQQLEQARLAVQTARRQLEVVERGALPEEIARARAELRQAERVGRARVDAARERVRELERGGRAPERRRAEAQLREARANLRQAEADLRRSEQLAAEGAISQAELDRARTALTQARAAVSVAEEQLELARQPASAEEIARARADLRAAEADYQESVRAARARLDELLNQPRPEDVRLARARVTEAQSAVRLAEEQLEKRTIRAPIGGLIVNRNVEPGQSVTPGQTLMAVADMTTAEVVVETDEDNLPQLRLGQTATVIAPAFPDRPFQAVVTRIGPQVVTERGVIDVTLDPVTLPEYARPDMTVDANIVVERLPSVPSVPASSVLEQGDEAYVLVVQDNIAVRKDVSILVRGAEYVGVAGIDANDRVIVNAAAIEPGQRVRVAEEES